MSAACNLHKRWLLPQLCMGAYPGICPYKKVVCLVVDECHRAKGNSDVVLAVKKLREEKCKFRVLGLSATPGSSNEAIQVCHLCVSSSAHCAIFCFFSNKFWWASGFSACWLHAVHSASSLSVDAANIQNSDCMLRAQRQVDQHPSNRMPSVFSASKENSVLLFRPLFYTSHTTEL